METHRLIVENLVQERMRNGDELKAVTFQTRKHVFLNIMLKLIKTKDIVVSLFK